MTFNFKKQKGTSKDKLLIIFIILFVSIITTNNFKQIENNGKAAILKKDKFDENDQIDALLPENSYIYYEDTPGIAMNVHVSGNYAFVADYDEHLQVINISDPTNPGVPIYELTPGYAEDVYVSGDYAYLAVNWFGLAIVNITDITDPEFVVFEDVLDEAYGVYVSGNYAYLAGGFWGLQIINISDPTNPGDPETADTIGNATDVYVQGNFAYVSTGDQGLAIINISNPNSPGTPEYANTTGYAWDVCVDGNYAYVADDTSGLAVINITDPTNPNVVAYEPTTGRAMGVRIDGDYAYVADDTAGLAVINITDPTNPGTPLYEDTSGNAYGVCVDGNYAYVADGSSGLAVIEISKNITPQVIEYTNPGNGYEVHVSGDYAYVAGDDGLYVVGISNPYYLAPPNIHFVSTTGCYYDVYVSGDYAYVADDYHGLGIIDISDPTNPGTPIYEATTGDPHGVYVDGDYAFVADNLDGLAIINISNPTEPGIVVEKDTTGNSRGVYVSGDYAYLAASTSGLAIINISDPTNPGDPIYKDTIGTAWDIYVDGNYAYLAIGTYGLAVIDISDPNNPGDPIYEDLYGDSRGIFVSGDYAYLSNGLGSGLAIVDISNPKDPKNPVYRLVQGSSYGLHVTGDFAYVASDSWIVASVKVKERTDMTDPVIIDQTSNFTIEAGYTGQSISWTATDLHNTSYTIELQGSGNVAGPSNWNNGTPIIYNIPEGFGLGSYLYTINITDIDGNFIKNTINFTVTPDITDPAFGTPPSNRTIEAGYTSETIVWIVNDWTNNTYTIERYGVGTVVGPTNWNSGLQTTYNIPNGFSVGDYIYIINFTDTWGNFLIDYVNITVEDTKAPSSTNPSNIKTNMDENIKVCWTLTDATGEGQYRVLVYDQGKTVNYTWVDWTNWTNGEKICAEINRNEKGIYIYSIEFRDNYGNYGTDDVVITIEEAPDGNEPTDDILILIMIIAAVVGIVAASTGAVVKLKSNKKRKARMKEIADYGDGESKNLIFVSYATVDSSLFRIPKMAQILSSYPEIDDVLYWEDAMHDDIYEYMDENLKRCKVVLLFCTKNSMSSEAVSMEWRSALKKQRKVIPIFIDQDDIPPLLTTKLGVQFNESDVVGSFEQIYKLIIKKLEIESTRQFCQFIRPKHISEQKFEPLTSLMAKEEAIIESAKTIGELELELAKILRENNFHQIEKAPDLTETEFKKLLGFGEQIHDASKIGVYIFIQKTEEQTSKILLRVMSDKKWMVEEVIKDLKADCEYLRLANN